MEITELEKFLKTEIDRAESRAMKIDRYIRERAARAYIEQCRRYERLSWWDYLGLISMAVIVSYFTVLLIVR